MLHRQSLSVAAATAQRLTRRSRNAAAGASSWAGSMLRTAVEERFADDDLWLSSSQAQEQHRPQLYTEPADEDLMLQLVNRRRRDSNSSTAVAVDPFAYCQVELDTLVATLRDDMLGTPHAVLQQAATYFFHDPGKMIRPTICLLLAQALAETVSASSGAKSLVLSVPLSTQRPDLDCVQRKLACVAELFHTASLLHDDVLDNADTRRNGPAVHTQLGPKLAILGGDFLLARASLTLARMRNADVVECMSTVLEHLVRGEVWQSSATPDNDDALLYYLRKTFYKTASLMALSAQSIALLGEYNDELTAACYQYGQHTGLAFQLIDDLLDFTGDPAITGKPIHSDVTAGIVTAPVLYAATEFPDLSKILQERNWHKNTAHVDTIIQAVGQSRGTEQTYQLASAHAEKAVGAVETHLAPSLARTALVTLAQETVLNRLR